MKLQSDHYFIQNKREKGSSKTPTERQSQYLDFLLTSLYQPITQDWLGKHLTESAAIRDRAETGWTQIMGDLIAELNESKDRVFIPSLASTDPAKTVWIKGRSAVPGVAEESTSFTQSCSANAIYLRLWETPLIETSSIIRQAHQLLTKGGVLLIEFISFSGFKAYPYHYSFSRAVDLLGELETDKSFPARLPVLLNQTGFGELEKVYSRPAFLPKIYNQVISVCLEVFRDEILQQTCTSLEEIDALLPSLQSFEEQKDTLICRPGVYLVMAIKK